MGAWLRDPRGIRIAIPSAGLVVGRSTRCDVVVADASVSRLHALVRPGPSGLTVVPLGPRPIGVGRARATALAPLRDGDELVVGTTRFVVEDLPRARPALVVLAVHDLRVPVRATPFAVGGGADDQLVVPGWPPRGLGFLEVRGRVLVERRAAIDVAGSPPWRADDLLAVAPAMTFRFAGDTLTVLDPEPTMATVDPPSEACSAALELLPNGGLLAVELGGPIRVYLPGRRCDLIAALLCPARGAAGDHVPDRELIRRIWGPSGATRAQLNMLIHRTRVTLAKAGLDGYALIERSSGGGSTRIAVAAGAPVEVQFTTR